MRKLSMIGLGLLALGVVSPSYAIDRDVRMIDTIGAEMASYHDVGYFGGSLWVENVLAPRSEAWAIVAGLGAGEYDCKDRDPATSWFGALGVKYYLTTFGSVALVGSYRNFENESNFDIVAGTMIFKLRFLPKAYVSPYLVASASLQVADFKAGHFTSQDESFNALVTTLGGGIDFMANDDFAFVFEGGVSDSEDFGNGTPYADGFYAGIYMRYYWQ